MDIGHRTRGLAIACLAAWLVFRAAGAVGVDYVWQPPVPVYNSVVDQLGERLRNPEATLAPLRRKAEAGDREAMLDLADLSYFDAPDEPSRKEALALYRSLATKGDSVAMVILGDLARRGLAPEGDGLWWGRADPSDPRLLDYESRYSGEQAYPEFTDRRRSRALLEKAFEVEGKRKYEVGAVILERLLAYEFNAHDRTKADDYGAFARTSTSEMIRDTAAEHGRSLVLELILDRRVNYDSEDKFRRAVKYSLDYLQELCYTEDGMRNADACYTLVIKFTNGNRGNPTDRTLVFDVLKRAADLGHREAQFLLGLGKVTGQLDGKTPLPEGWKDIEKAADMGHLEAMAMVAGRYLPEFALEFNRSEGAEFRDRAKGISWLVKAAKDGLPSAQYFLAECLHQGRYIATDLTHAAHWYQAAAMQGHPAAMLKLADMAAYGDGMEADLLKSYVWLALYGKTGEPNRHYLKESPNVGKGKLKAKLTSLRDSLTPNQRTLAARIIERMVPHIFARLYNTGREDKFSFPSWGLPPTPETPLDNSAVVINYGHAITFFSDAWGGTGH